MLQTTKCVPLRKEGRKKKKRKIIFVQYLSLKILLGNISKMKIVCSTHTPCVYIRYIRLTYTYIVITYLYFLATVPVSYYYTTQLRKIPFTLVSTVIKLIQITSENAHFPTELEISWNISIQRRNRMAESGDIRLLFTLSLWSVTIYSQWRLMRSHYQNAWKLIY